MKPLSIALASLALCLNLLAEGAAPATGAAATRPAASAPAASAPAANVMRPRVKLQTSLGDIVLELDAQKAPASVLNFLQYAEEEFYAGTIFHRVMSDFMIQAGGFTTDFQDKKGSHPPIVNEWRNGLRNERGAVAMARLGNQPDSATNEFFINVVDNPNLDSPQMDGAAYAVFGRVVEGMDVVDKIRFAPVMSSPIPGFQGQRITPAETIKILAVKPVGGVTRKMIVDALEAERQTAIKAEREAQARIAGEIKRLEEAAQKEIEAIVKKSAEELKATPERDVSGIVTFVLQEGKGPVVSPKATVQTHYRGTLADGSEFDNSYERGKPLAFSLAESGMIEGYRRAVEKMKVGEKRRVIIPPRLGYGAQSKPGSPGKSGIPANSPLIFDIELISAAP